MVAQHTFICANVTKILRKNNLFAYFVASLATGTHENNQNSDIDHSSVAYSKRFHPGAGHE
jgi:hypothetical protein